MIEKRYSRAPTASFARSSALCGALPRGTSRATPRADSKAIPPYLRIWRSSNMRRPMSGAAVPAKASSPRLLSGSKPLCSRGPFRAPSSSGSRRDPRGATSGTSARSLPTVGQAVSRYEVAGLTKTMELSPFGLRIPTARESIPPHDSPSRMGLSLHLRDSLCHDSKNAPIAPTRSSAVDRSSPGIRSARSSKCRVRSANCGSANMWEPSKPGT
mmetsp:Transcript_19482/g.49368  ORF Transcript_19482/g.49368 Transcript_19482/m.49368 type:complete len:214 (-) Transcript_19482:716-1357(-)